MPEPPGPNFPRDAEDSNRDKSPLRGGMRTGYRHRTKNVFAAFPPVTEHQNQESFLQFGLRWPRPMASTVARVTSRCTGKSLRHASKVAGGQALQPDELSSDATWWMTLHSTASANPLGG